jgi:hypothetical protein
VKTKALLARGAGLLVDRRQTASRVFARAGSDGSEVTIGEKSHGGRRQVLWRSCVGVVRHWGGFLGAFERLHRPCRGSVGARTFTTGCARRAVPDVAAPVATGRRPCRGSNGDAALVGTVRRFFRGSNGEALRGRVSMWGVVFHWAARCHACDALSKYLARGCAGARREMGVFIGKCAMSCGGRVLGRGKNLLGWMEKLFSREGGGFVCAFYAMRTGRRPMLPGAAAVGLPIGGTQLNRVKTLDYAETAHSTTPGGAH